MNNWFGYTLFFLFVVICVILLYLDRKEDRECKYIPAPKPLSSMVVPMVLDEGAIFPTRAHPADAGLDLCSPRPYIIDKGQYRLIDTGVHIEIPKGHVGLILSKSGLMTKNQVTTTGGVIDAEYTGSIMVQLYNHSNAPFPIQRGQKIAQLVILPIKTPNLLRVDDLGKTERGSDGFGSSGDIVLR